MLCPGHYAYYEASGGDEGDTAVFYSPVLDWGTEQVFLSFWYMMHGIDVGKLTVFTASPDNSSVGRTDLWTHGTATGQIWNFLQLEFIVTEPVRVSADLSACTRARVFDTT